MKKERSRKKRAPKLGQHFLTGMWAAAKLAECIAIQPDETILEIGPGKGALTKELIKTGARVVAVEKDETLVAELRGTFRKEIESGQLQLVSQDIRDFNPSDQHALHASSYVLAANIPYYITGEILRKFLTARPQPRTLALLVQKEVAERIVARNGKESILSISVKAYGTPKVISKVSRGNFSPPPSVDSAILRINSISRAFFSNLDEAHFFAVVKTAFASKRKLLSGNLKKKFENVDDALNECGIPKNARAEDLPLDAWSSLARHLLPR